MENESSVTISCTLTASELVALILATDYIKRILDQITNEATPNLKAEVGLCTWLDLNQFLINSLTGNRKRKR